MEELAINGGSKVRERPIEINPIISSEEIEEVVKVLKSGQITQLSSPEIREFEEAFASYLGVNYCIAVNSGTAALHIALAAAGIEPGDEVIVPPFTFVATATAVLHQNALPVFADIDPLSYCLDPKDVKRKITTQTKAIIAVDIFGHPANMDEIKRVAKKNNLIVIEDAAQAHGSKYKGRLCGTLGDISCFSFQESKNMTCGEGGIVATNDPKIERECRLLRHHGEPAWYVYERLGWNYRMTAMEAALGIVQLKKLGKFNAQRVKVAKTYERELKDLPFTLPKAAPYAEVIPHVYTMLIPKELVSLRDKIKEAIEAEGVPVGICYPQALYLTPLFQNRTAYGKNCPWSCSNLGKEGYRRGLCPVCEDVASRALTLFTHPSLGGEEVEDIVKAVRKVVKTYLERN